MAVCRSRTYGTRCTIWLLTDIQSDEHSLYNRFHLATSAIHGDSYVAEYFQLTYGLLSTVIYFGEMTSLN